jgi:CheY-like chemotaxis protein
MGTAGHVLVVEDHPGLRSLLEALLSAAGYLCKPFQPQALLRLVETVAAPAVA